MGCCVLGRGRKVGQMKWMATTGASDLTGWKAALSRGAPEAGLSAVPLLGRVTAPRTARGGRAQASGQPASCAGKEAPCMGW